MHTTGPKRATVHGSTANALRPDGAGDQQYPGHGEISTPENLAPAELTENKLQIPETLNV